MKKKNLLLGILAVFMVFVLTGCGKKALTTSEFKSKAEAKGYVNVDVIDQYKEYGVFKEATVAKKNEDYQVEFYVLNTVEDAENMFDTNKSLFESNEGSYSTKSSVNMKNYSTFTLNNDEYYMYLCRVDNTLLYVKVKDIYKSNVKDLVKDLGY